MVYFWGSTGSFDGASSVGTGEEVAVPVLWAYVVDDDAGIIE